MYNYFLMKDKNERENMHTKDKGDWSEAEAIAAIRRNTNYIIYTPFGDNSSIDMIIEKPTRELIRIQVKTATYTNGCVCFQTRSINSNKNKNWQTTYEDLIDWFIIYSPDMNECYAVHIDECGSSNKRLRVDEPNVSNPNINWAEDYILDEDTF